MWNPNYLQKLLTIGVGAASGFLMACSTTKIPGVYRIDIQQGNVVTQEMLDKLEPDMEKRKVRHVLGSPLIENAFDRSRWDYYYSFQQSGGDRVQRRISLYFDNEKLARVDGNVRTVAGTRPPPETKGALITVPDQERRSGLLGILKGGFRSDKGATGDTSPMHHQEQTPVGGSTAESKDADSVPGQASPPPAAADTASSQPHSPERARETQKSEADRGGQTASTRGPPVAGHDETQEPLVDDDEDGGFFSRLARRFRLRQEPESTTISNDESATGVEQAGPETDKAQ